MANIASGLNSGIQGAKLGSNFGPWGTLIGGIGGALFGLGASDPNKALLESQKKYNAEVVRNTAQSLFDREREQQVSRMRTARALQSYQAQGKTQISTVRANYGAADLVGASAQALAQTLDFQTKQAEAATLFNYGVDFANYNTAIDQITKQGVNSVQQEIQAVQQKGLDLAGLLGAGKGLLGAAKSVMGGTGFSAGLQLGSTPQSAAPQTSNYSLPSNLNLQFKGF